MPDRPSSGSRAAPAGPPRPPGPPDPLLDDLDEPLTEDELDPLDAWPDDEPLEAWPDDESPPPDLPDPLAFEPDDENGDLLDLLDDGPTEPESVDALEPLVLPWRTRARLPDHDVGIDAVLDPTRERTTWSGGIPGPLRIVLGGAEWVVEPEITDGPPLLRVGRDVLSGRILVES